MSGKKRLPCDQCGDEPYYAFDFSAGKRYCLDCWNEVNQGP